MRKREFSKTHLHPQKDTTQRLCRKETLELHQYEVIPDLLDEVGVLKPKLLI